MTERESGPELSYWELKPQFKTQMHDAIKTAYQTNGKSLEKIIDTFGEFPRVRIEMADRRGIFKQMSEKYINIMMDIYFTPPGLTLIDIAKKNGLNHKSRVSQINNRIINRLAIVRNRNLKYLDAEFQPLYQEEAWAEANRQEIAEQEEETRIIQAERDVEKKEKRAQEIRRMDQELIDLRGRGYRFSQIEKITGRPINTLHSRSKILRERGINVPIFRRRPRSEEELNAFDEQVKQLYIAGLSYKKIVKSLTSDFSRVEGSLNRLARKKEIKRGGPKD